MMRNDTKKHRKASVKHDMNFYLDVREMVRRKANGVKRKIDEDMENYKAGNKCRYYRTPQAWENVQKKYNMWLCALDIIDLYISAKESTDD